MFDNKRFKIILAEMIINNIKEEFRDKHLTENLINTLRIEENDEGIKIFISAPKYSFKKWFQSKIIKHTSGSYAQALDSEGSKIVFYDKSGKRHIKKIGNHIGFVENVIQKSIEQLSQLSGLKIESEII